MHQDRCEGGALSHDGRGVELCTIPNKGGALCNDGSVSGALHHNRNIGGDLHLGGGRVMLCIVAGVTTAQELRLNSFPFGEVLKGSSLKLFELLCLVFLRVVPIPYV